MCSLMVVETHFQRDSRLVFTRLVVLPAFTFIIVSPLTILLQYLFSAQLSSSERSIYVKHIIGWTLFVSWLFVTIYLNWVFALQTDEIQLSEDLNLAQWCSINFFLSFLFDNLLFENLKVHSFLFCSCINLGIASCYVLISTTNFGNKSTFYMASSLLVVFCVPTVLK